MGDKDVKTSLKVSTCMAYLEAITWHHHGRQGHYDKPKGKHLANLEAMTWHHHERQAY